MIKTRTWLIIISIIFIVSSAVSFFLYRWNTAGTVANVYLDGDCIYSVDLLSVSEAYSKTIICKDGGVNVLRIEHGRICVESADCKDHVCVDTGWIVNSSMPIVCLPHRLVIKIEKETSDGNVTMDSVVK